MGFQPGFKTAGLLRGAGATASRFAVRRPGTAGGLPECARSSHGRLSPGIIGETNVPTGNSRRFFIELADDFQNAPGERPCAAPRVRFQVGIQARQG